MDDLHFVLAIQNHKTLSTTCFLMTFEVFFTLHTFPMYFYLLPLLCCTTGFRLSTNTSHLYQMFNGGTFLELFWISVYFRNTLSVCMFKTQSVWKYNLKLRYCIFLYMLNNFLHGHYYTLFYVPIPSLFGDYHNTCRYPYYIRNWNQYIILSSEFQRFLHKHLFKS